jgi:hypothetical protein
MTKTNWHDIVIAARLGKDVSHLCDIFPFSAPDIKYDDGNVRVYGCGAVMVRIDDEWYPDNSNVDGWVNYNRIRRGGKRVR